MCGILAVIHPERSRAIDTERFAALSARQRHRGPDHRGVAVGRGFALAHERLAIVDPSGGDQPFQSADGRLIWAANAEIYNHEQLKAQLPRSGEGGAQEGSDCAVIGPLYRRFGDRFVSMLDGMFALFLADRGAGRFVIARDHMGICPLYVGTSNDGSTWFASEMKCLLDECDDVRIFPPGWMAVVEAGRVQWNQLYCPQWQEPDFDAQCPPESVPLRRLLIESVRKRLMSDVPFGVLLSGGLDSSLIASIAARLVREHGTGPLHTFSIGLAGSPDLAAARQTAAFLGTQHHEFQFTVAEAMAAVEPTVEHLESFEQVRAGVPLYLLSRHIREAGFRMVLSGEGADEIFGGYLYFHRAPGARALQDECGRLLMRLHQWDVMRANKAAMSHGVEVRVPFLDRAFLDAAMSVDPRAKMIDMSEFPDGRHPKMEKHLLRAAFADQHDPWLPEAILWRQKEQFSDGVGYGWVDALRRWAAVEIDDRTWALRSSRFERCPPHTREYYLLREMFERRFVTGRRAGQSALMTVPMTRSIACSTPEALAWDPQWRDFAGDVSGRSVSDVHCSRAARVA